MLKNLKKIQSKMEKKNKSKLYLKAEGFREAILDIVKAFQGFKKNFSTRKTQMQFRPANCS